MDLTITLRQLTQTLIDMLFTGAFAQWTIPALVLFLVYWLLGWAQGAFGESNTDPDDSSVEWRGRRD
jgi:hypothetical protein